MSYNRPLWRKTQSLDYEIVKSNLDPFIKDDMVSLPFPAGTVAFKQFKAVRGSGWDVLYWTYTHTGPGSNTTTYTVWNGPAE